MSRPPKPLPAAPGRRWYLKEWRDFRDLTQEALGARAGFTQGAISQLENNDVDYNASNLEKLSEALNCTIRELLFRDPNDPEDVQDILDSMAPEAKETAIEVLKTLKRRSEGAT